MPNKNKMKGLKKRAKKAVRSTAKAVVAHIEGRDFGSYGARPRVTRGVGGAYSPDATAVCGITDPFCPHAIGAKWPDGSTRPSLAWRTRYHYPVIATVSGHVSYVLFASSRTTQSLVTSYSATVGGLEVIPSISADFLNVGVTPVPFPDGTSEYRLVSSGIRIIPTAPATKNQGYFIVSSVDGVGVFGTPTTNTLVTSTMYTDSCSYPLNAGEATWVAKPAGTESHQFKPVKAWGNQNEVIADPNNDWTICLVAFPGCEVGQVPAVIEVVQHFELVFNAGSAMSLMSAGAPPKADRVLDAAAAVQNAVPASSPGSHLNFGNIVKGLAGKAVKTGGKALLKHFL